MSTKVQLRTAIKRESRVLATANLDTLIDEIVADIMRDYCNLARYHELLTTGVVLALVNGQQSYSLPADYQNMDVVRYSRGPSPFQAWKVIDIQPPTVKQTWSNNSPRFYRLVGTKISLWPYGQILATDQLQIDYYVTPSSLYTSDSSTFPVDRLEGAVKKDAIARVQRFHSATTESQMTDADGRASYNAGRGAT